MLAVVASLLLAANAFAATGTFRISTDPQGAEVWIDGQQAGNAPMTLAVPVGKHAISAKMPGREEASVTAEARAGEIAEILLPLGVPGQPPRPAGADAPRPPEGEAGNGRIAILQPEGATILVDGAPVVDEHRANVKVPVTLPSIPAGLHRISLTIPGGHREEVMVTVPRDGEVRVDQTTPRAVSEAPDVERQPPQTAGPGAPPPYSQRPGLPPPPPVAPLAPSNGPVGAPRNVRVWTPDSAGKVKIEWDYTPGATGFIVSRGDSPQGPFFRASGDAPIPVTTLLLAGFTAGTKYYFRVSAVSGAGVEGDPSAVAETP